MDSRRFAEPSRARRSAQSILICADNDYADAVAAIESVCKLCRAKILRALVENFGAILVVNDLQTQAPELVNQLAPEYLELAVAEPDAMADQRYAGVDFSWPTYAGSDR